MSGIYYSILSQVQTSVITIVANTVLRRKLHLLEGIDTLPICIIAPGMQGEKIVQTTMKKGVWWNYPVLVAYIEAGDRAMQTGLQAYMLTRESIRNALYQLGGPIGTVAGVFDLNMNTEAIVGFSQYLSTNYDVTGFEVTYTSAESRTN